jgi:hypothetical protein
MIKKIFGESKSLEQEFTDRSNYIIQELDSFFGPIDGFTWQFSNDTKVVDGLEKFDTGKYQEAENKDLFYKTIKEERYVCNNIVGIYKKSLKSLLKNKIFRGNAIDFVKTKFGKDYEKYFNDPEYFDVKIRNHVYNNKDKDTDSYICNTVIDYYFLKYKIYRLIKNIDPYSKDYDQLKKQLEFYDRPQSTDNDKKMIKNIQDKLRQMERKRRKFQESLNETLKSILDDNLNYRELTKVYGSLVDSNELQDYAENLSSVCEDVGKYIYDQTPSAVSGVKKFETEPIKLGGKHDRLERCNMNNYKELRILKAKILDLRKNIIKIKKDVNLIVPNGTGVLIKSIIDLFKTKKFEETIDNTLKSDIPNAEKINTLNDVMKILNDNLEELSKKKDNNQ